MKKILIVVFVLAALPAFSFDFFDYFMHMNSAIGGIVPFGGETSGNDSVVTVTLPGSPPKSFLFSPQDLGSWPVGLNIGFNIPVYYNKRIALSGTLEIDIYGAFVTIFGGAYFECYLNQKWSLAGRLGGSLFILDKGLGTLGGYGISITGMSSSFGFQAGVKYHFFKYLFLEAAYQFSGKYVVSDYKIKVDDRVIPNSGTGNPLTVKPSHGIILRIGIGI
jgi:hypothetical protein